MPVVVGLGFPFCLLCRLGGREVKEKDWKVSCKYCVERRGVGDHSV
jgi:hypothetical protein